MRILRLSGTVLVIVALSNPFGAYAESTDENGDQGAETKPVTRSDPDCDHTNGLLMPG